MKKWETAYSGSTFSCKESALFLSKTTQTSLYTEALELFLESSPRIVGEDEDEDEDEDEIRR